MVCERRLGQVCIKLKECLGRNRTREVEQISGYLVKSWSREWQHRLTGTWAKAEPERARRVDKINYSRRGRVPLLSEGIARTGFLDLQQRNELWTVVDGGGYRDACSDSLAAVDWQQKHERAQPTIHN